MMLAMASLSKLLVVTLHPDLRVTYVHTLTGDALTLPLLAWHFVVVQLSDKQRVVDPVLAFARDQTVYFVQVCDSSSSSHQPFNGHINTTEQRTIVEQYSDWYTGH